MINKNFVVEKIKLISQGLEQLKSFENMTFAEVAGDYIKYSALKNILMETIGRAIDINEHLINASGKNLDVPITYRTTFLAMEQIGVLPPEFAREVAKSAGFRNAIVHEYNNLDKSAVYKTVGQAIGQYKLYCDYIMKYLDGR